ncbi:MAG: family 1 glycosylhydrolase [Actinomycetota bacterium]|nr:family 1 glycosylhydrolase [Actinomycetota bacterium]
MRVSDLAVLEAGAFPGGFSFGVATAGFQVEGGYNGPGQPRNNWYDWEAAGRVEPSGIANDSWRRFEEDLDVASAMGLDTFRLSVEWARVQPTASASATENEEEPPFDRDAVERYVEILAAARGRGLDPLVTLHHFTLPRWLGLSFWQREDSPRVFAAYVRQVVTLLDEGLAARGEPPIRRYVTLNEINALAIGTWFGGWFPGGRPLHLPDLRRGLDHLLAAHVRAYDAVHDVHVERGWARPQVITNNVSLSIYESDRSLIDLLLARRRGVDRDALPAYLADRRTRWRSVCKRMAGPSQAASELLLAGLARWNVRHGLPATSDALYASPRPDKLDAIAIDFYAPWAKGRFRAPGHRTSGERWRYPVRPLWEDPPAPGAFVDFCRANADEPGLPLWVVENGLCNRVHDGVSYPRPDGWNRVRYLRAYLGRLAAAVAEGLPVEAYLHWTLYDNYEWGSYEPRFGLLGVDRSRGATRLERDSMGDDAAGAYGTIVRALRTGQGLDAAFTA